MQYSESTAVEMPNPPQSNNESPTNQDIPTNQNPIQEADSLDKQFQEVSFNRVSVEKQLPLASDIRKPAWATELANDVKSRRDDDLLKQRNYLLCLVAVLAIFSITFISLYSAEKGKTAYRKKTYTNVMCSDPCGSVCWGDGQACFDECYKTCMSKSTQRPGLLSDMLDLNAIQHIGVTVSNITKSLDFYVNILGGVEVLNAGGDGWYGDDDKHGSVYQLLMQHELLAGEPYSSYTADLKDGGYDEMEARYINFGVLQVEILDYRAKKEYGPKGTDQSDLQHFKVETAPSVVGNTHFAFLVDSDTSLNDFVTKLENVSHARGHENVRCNTVQNMTSEAARKKYVRHHPEWNSYQVTDGDFAGWQLAYCKGPDNEQIEFNHAYSNAGSDFTQARGVYVTGGKNELWRRRLLRVTK